MPQLDVSFMTLDPMLADDFVLTRRTESVDQKGRSQPAVEQVFGPDDGCVGVVTQESPAELMRTPEFQTAPRQIMVCTMFQVIGASTGRQPDVITWNGTDYTVTSVLPYSRYGGGTYEVVAVSTAPTDNAQ